MWRRAGESEFELDGGGILSCSASALVSGCEFVPGLTGRLPGFTSGFSPDYTSRKRLKVTVDSQVTRI